MPGHLPVRCTAPSPLSRRTRSRQDHSSGPFHPAQTDQVQHQSQHSPNLPIHATQRSIDPRPTTPTINPPHPLRLNRPRMTAATTPSSPTPPPTTIKTQYTTTPQLPQTTLERSVSNASPDQLRTTTTSRPLQPPRHPLSAYRDTHHHLRARPINTTPLLFPTSTLTTTAPTPYHPAHPALHPQHIAALHQLNPSTTNLVQPTTTRHAKPYSTRSTSISTTRRQNTTPRHPGLHPARLTPAHLSTQLSTHLAWNLAPPTRNNGYSADSSGPVCRDTPCPGTAISRQSRQTPRSNATYPQHTSSNGIQ